MRRQGREGPRPSVQMVHHPTSPRRWEGPGCIPYPWDISHIPAAAGRARGAGARWPVGRDGRLASPANRSPTVGGTIGPHGRRIIAAPLARYHDFASAPHNHRAAIPPSILQDSLGDRRGPHGRRDAGQRLARVAERVARDFAAAASACTACCCNSKPQQQAVQPAVATASACTASWARAFTAAANRSPTGGR